MSIKLRHLMAPDTETADEELALVMREARELAVQRRATADAGVAARLKDARFNQRVARSTTIRSGRARSYK